MFAYSIQASSGVAHNGPICGTCRVPYIGTHRCSPDDLDRLIDQLSALRDRAFDEQVAKGQAVVLDLKSLARPEEMDDA